MELRHYLRILQRSWPLVVGLPLLVAILTVALAFILPQRYTITAAMLVTQRPIAVSEPQVTLPDENNFNNWATAEFIVDDILQLVETRQFATDIALWLRTQHGITLDPKDISDGLEAERQHRMIYLHVAASRQDYARLIAQGAIAKLQEVGLGYWGRSESTSLTVSLLDLPDRAAGSRNPVSLAIDLVLRGLLALILAIGLAFLRHYLDQTMYRRGEVEALGFEVVGLIPAEHRRGARR
jgi:capsular polysaccharide biosynthesis protein